METKKAGCFLINLKLNKIALVEREIQKDYTFPKGHLEDSETFAECAIRETAEETKRVASILNNYPPYIQHYTKNSGEKCVCYMYFALDEGKSDNTYEDTHIMHWIDIDAVEDLLSYDSLKNDWRLVKPTVIKIIKENTNNESD